MNALQGQVPSPDGHLPADRCRLSSGAQAPRPPAGGQGVTAEREAGAGLDALQQYRFVLPSAAADPT